MSKTLLDRRTLLKSASAAGAAALHAAARFRAIAGKGGRGRRRLCRRKLRARIEARRAECHPGRAECDLHRLSVLQRRAGRPAAAHRAAVRLRRDQEGRHHGCAAERDAGRSGRKAGHARRRQHACLRPPGARAGHRPALRCAARLQRRGCEIAAARLEGRRADDAVAQSARGDGRRRHGRDRRARQSVPLPAGAV